ncbi:MAG: antibiotic biosynthesis monooxygenase family protein [Mycobacteriales bacterium]
MARYQPHRWHVNDGSEVSAVLDGALDMHYRDQGKERLERRASGRVCVAEEGDRHVAFPSRRPGSWSWSPKAACNTLETTFANTPEPPYVAVIFTSTRTEGDHGYAAMAESMNELASKQPGFLSVESARDGVGITVSYWVEKATAGARKEVAAHSVGQRRGREVWYQHYRMRIATVDRDYSMSSSLLAADTVRRRRGMPRAATAVADSGSRTAQTVVHFDDGRASPAGRTR